MTDLMAGWPTFETSDFVPSPEEGKPEVPRRLVEDTSVLVKRHGRCAVVRDLKQGATRCALWVDHEEDCF